MDCTLVRVSHFNLFYLVDYKLFWIAKGHTYVCTFGNFRYGLATV